MTDHNEAMRLADACKHGWIENVDPDKCGLDDLLTLLRQLSAERDQLRAVVESLRADAERLDHIEKHARCDPKMDGQHVWWPTNFKNALRGPNLRAAIDHAIEAAKE